MQSKLLTLLSLIVLRSLWSNWISSWLLLPLRICPPLRVNVVKSAPLPSAVLCSLKVLSITESALMVSENRSIIIPELMFMRTNCSNWGARTSAVKFEAGMGEDGRIGFPATSAMNPLCTVAKQLVMEVQTSRTFSSFTSVCVSSIVILRPIR